MSKGGGFWIGTTLFLVLEALFLGYVRYTNQKSEPSETMCASALSPAGNVE